MTDSFLEPFLNPGGFGALPPSTGAIAVPETPEVTAQRLATAKVAQTKPGGDPYWNDPNARTNPFPAATSALSGIGATINNAASAEMTNAADARANPAAHSVAERVAGFPAAAQSMMRFGATPQEQANFAVADAKPSLMDSISQWFRGIHIGGTPPAAVAAPPAAVAVPSDTGMTTADIQGQGIPAPGTGAMVNNSTGRVTNFNTGAPARMGARVAMAAPSGFSEESGSSTNNAPTGSIASALGAIMNIKERTSAQNRTAAVQAAQLHAGGTMKERAEAAEIQARLALAGKAASPAQAADIVNKHAQVKDDKVELPIANQPTTNPDKSVNMVVTENGKKVFKNVPLQQTPQIATQVQYEADIAKLGSKTAVDAEYAKRNITPPTYGGLGSGSENPRQHW